MEVDCAQSGYIVTNHPSLVKKVFYILDGNSPTFPVGQFSYSESGCPITKIEFFNTDKVTSPPTGLSPGSETGVNVNAAINVIATNKNIGGYYPFSIKITLKGGQVHWANLGSDEEFILQVCGSETITKQLTSDPDYKEYYQSQGVAPNYEKTEADVVTWFKSSDPACPVSTYTLESPQGTQYTGNDISLV